MAALTSYTAGSSSSDEPGVEPRWNGYKVQSILNPKIPFPFKGVIHSDIPIVARPFSNPGDGLRHSLDQLVIADRDVEYGPDQSAIKDKYSLYHPRIAAIMRRNRIQSGTDVWKQVRVNLLTATNAASLTLPPKVRSSFQPGRAALLKAKTGVQAGQQFPMTACDYGIEQEQHAARIFTQVTGIELVEEDVGLLIHPQEEFIGATPDRLAKYFPVIIEIKCPYRAVIKHAPPVYYIPQVQLQLEVCDLDVCFFVQYRPSDLVNVGMIDITVVERDRDWFAKWLPEFRSFWSEVLATRLELQRDDATGSAKRRIDVQAASEEKETAAIRKALQDAERALSESISQENVEICLPTSHKSQWSNGKDKPRKSRATEAAAIVEAPSNSDDCQFVGHDFPDPTESSATMDWS